MEVTPLAADSMGVRSLAMGIEAAGETVLVDPGASLGPRRDGKRPHPEEYRTLKERSESIQAWGDRADVILVTHYHFDHYVPSFENWRYNWSSEDRSRRLFEDVTVLAKHTTESINYSQRKRGYYFDRVCEDVSDDQRYVDGATVEWGDLVLDFSEPVPHGPAETDLGDVLMVAIEGLDETVVYTSDVQGPVVDASREWILERDPDLVIVDGPPTYLSEETFAPPARRSARTNMAALAREADLIVDHHLLRDGAYEAYLEPVFEAAREHGRQLQTAAAFRGESNRLLEARRAELHEESPVEDEFYDRVADGEFVDEPIP
ncbi:MAG: MBL fold metallo-hydrolase [Halodesulfurarchaeum sp.]